MNECKHHLFVCIMLLIPRERLTPELTRKFVNLFSDSDPRWNIIKAERRTLYDQFVLLTPRNNLLDLHEEDIDNLQCSTSKTIMRMSPSCFAEFRRGKVELWRTFFRETPESKSTIFGMIPIPSRASLASTMNRFVSDWKRTCATDRITWRCTRAHTIRPVNEQDATCECCITHALYTGDESYGIDVLCGEKSLEEPEIVVECKLSSVAEYHDNVPLYLEVSFPQKPNTFPIHVIISLKDSTSRSCRKIREAYTTMYVS